MTSATKKKTLTIRQVRSGIGFDQTQKATLRALGLEKIGPRPGGPGQRADSRDDQQDSASRRHREGLRFSMKQNTLKPAPGLKAQPQARGPRPRIRHGQDLRRGEKGQKSRSGYSAKRGFEGGQMPLHRRVPKRGFTNIFRIEYRTVNVDRLNELPAGSEVTPESLQKAGAAPQGRQAGQDPRQRRAEKSR
jgi:ribosomal protein L15